MSSSDIIVIITATISALLSVIALFVAYFSYRGSVQAAAQPVLVFSMVSTFRWHLQNVGSGPAINVVVVDWHRDRRIDSVTNCYPVAAGGYLELGWLRAGWELAAVYTDVFGNSFSSLCSANRNTLYKSNVFPDIVADTDQWVHELLNSMPDPSPLRADDLRGKTAQELDRMRNEIYARHGYVFNRPDLREYFAKQKWYTPSTGSIKQVLDDLSQRERYEAQLIRDFQRRFGLLIDD